MNIPNEADYILCLSLEPRKNLNASLKTFEVAIKELKSKSLYLVLTGAEGWINSNNFLKIFHQKQKKNNIY